MKSVGLIFKFLQFGFLATLTLKSFAQNKPPKSEQTIIQALSQKDIDGLLINVDGYMVINSTTNCINYWVKGKWFELCGTCLPKPSIPKVETYDIEFNDLTVNFRNDTLSEGEYNVVLILPDTIKVKSRYPQFNVTDIKEGTHQLWIYRENPCGMSTPTKVADFEITHKNYCGLEKFIEVNGKKINIASLGSNCWMVEDWQDSKFKFNDKNAVFTTSDKVQLYKLSSLIAQSDKICPQNWRLPTEQEAQSLISELNEKEIKVEKFNSNKSGAYSKKEGLIASGAASVYALDSKGKVLVLNINGGLITETDASTTYVSVRCVKATD